ncbi:MAG: reverse transcriptase N-terminal domain-containing protein, partial [Dolichospermum sp.]|nr:reverse transcriptase N-terminal domain-containing protein [Dolichospermum sp.]
MQKIRISKYNWNNIHWSSLQSKLFKWQQRIYLASKEGNIIRVRKLQHLLLGSEMARLIAVKKVTQDNKGKKTAGVDGVKSLTPNQRLILSQNLQIPQKASKLRRVWIAKPGKQEKRPLGIPTIKDRALQCLVKFALEPEWEAKFEPNSYGFRPGRNAHDAVKAIYDHIIKRSKYALDADIKKCFDSINHEALLIKIGVKGNLRKQIQYWLKAGVLDGGIVSNPTEGTPQGGVISPLLANIALHGMETHLKNCFQDIKCYTANDKPIKKNRIADSLAVIRYADDFVILHDDIKVILRCKEEVCKF